MFKFIFWALVIIGAVTTVPPIRERVLPPIAHALGPTGEKMLTPMKRWKARSVCEDLVQELHQSRVQGKGVPAEKDFFAWSQRYTDPPGGKDPWGQPYFMKQVRKVITVGSDGADQKRGTKDDIVVTSTWN